MTEFLLELWILSTTHQGAYAPPMAKACGRGNNAFSAAEAFRES